MMGSVDFVTVGELVDPRVLVCNCGKVTTFRCCELWAHPGLLPCNAPLCGLDCKQHRHLPGTMGYVNFTTGSADYLGYKPDAPGFFHWVRALWRDVTWSNRRKAQEVWDRMRTRFPPPSPLPPFVLRFGNTHFAAFGDEMKELK